MLLDRITTALNKGSRNYTVFLRWYDLGDKGGDSQSLIANAFGRDTVIGSIEEVDGAEVITEIESCLRYTGDRDSGPDVVVLNSSEYESLVGELKAELTEMVQSASKIEKFWLKSGHPAYPVFWDFAQMLTLTGERLILIGSSSD